MRLLQAIAAGKASARLLQDRGVTINLESSGLPGVSERIAVLLRVFLPRIKSWWPYSIGGARDFWPPRLTRAWVPRSSRSTARSAISSAGKGAKVGPQLDGIGTRGLDRLMEDILDPNRNVDQTLRIDQHRAQ